MADDSAAEKSAPTLVACYQAACARMTTASQTRAVLASAGTNSATSPNRVRKPPPHHNKVRPQRSVVAACAAVDALSAASPPAAAASNTPLVSIASVGGEFEVSLDMRTAYLGDQGAAALLVALADWGGASPVAIVAINMAGAGLRQGAVEALVDFLGSAGGRRVKRCDVSGNEFLAVSAGMVLTARAAEWPAMQDFRISGTNIPAHHVKRIAEACSGAQEV